jgi:hypothetical protein
VASNNLHKTERVIIERCFGQLKRRFPVLQHLIRVGTDKIPSVIISCFVLNHHDKVEDLFQKNDDLEADVEENQREIIAKKT